MNKICITPSITVCQSRAAKAYLAELSKYRTLSP